MRVKILKRSFAGAEFAPDVRVLKVGGQSSAGWKSWNLSCRQNGRA